MTDAKPPIDGLGRPAPALAGRLLQRLARAAGAERERWPLWLPVAFGSGIGIYFTLPSEPSLAGALLAMVLAGAAAVMLRHRGLALVATLLLLTVILGFTVAAVRSRVVEAPSLTEPLPPLTVTGRVRAVEVRPRGYRLLLDDLVLPGLAPEETPEKARVSVTSGVPDLSPGERVSLRAKLSPPPEPALPGAFDFARKAYFERLGAVGFAYGRPRRLAPDGEAAGFSLWLTDLREGLAARIRAALPGPPGAVAAALMTGERGAIPKAVLEDMRDSGLAHLIAISGLHIGLVAGLLFFALRALLAAVPPLALHQPIKKWAAVAALLGAAAYLLLTGMTVPTQRAFAMTAVALAAVMLDRNPLSLRLVALAAVVVLLIAPESLVSPSFQMSFAAVIGLIAGYETLGGRLARARLGRGPGARLAIGLLALAFTSLIAVVATAPFAIYHFNRLALFGLAANLIAVPLTTFWIMPWALAAYLLMPLGLEGLALAPMGWGLEGVLATARTIAALPGAVALVPAIPPHALVLMVFGGLWLSLWRRRWRRLGMAAILLGMASGLLERPPDVVASGDGRLLGVRSEGGELMLSSRRRARFTAEIWGRRLGADEAEGWPTNGTAAEGRLTCDPLACLYRAGGQVVALVRDGRALAEDCRMASVVVSLEPLRGGRCSEPAALVDRFDLWREGGHAIWLSAESVRVVSVADRRGKRPWVRRRGWDQ